MKLYLRSGQYPGRIVDLTGSLTIGRGQDNDMVLEAEGISRHHCRLTEQNGIWKVEDLGSTNGVRVNGLRISEPTTLKKGDDIELFDQALVFTDEAGVAALQREEGKPQRAASSAPASSAGAAASGPGASEKSGVPWGHLVLVVILAAIVGWALYASFSGSEEEQQPGGGTEQAEGTEQAQDEEGTGGEEEAAGEEAVPADEEIEPGPPPEVAAEIVEEPLDEGDDDAAVPAVAELDEEAPALPAAGAEEKQAVVISSNPEGAEVLLDGERAGVTPVVLPGVAPGRHVVTVNKDGYRELTRRFLIPGMPPETYELRLKPGVVRVQSTPHGATVMHGSQVLGNTPLLVRTLPPGTHDLRFVSYGYKTVVQPVTVPDENRVAVELESLLGEIQVVTLPAGCEVHVDDTFKGTTVQAENIARNQSAPFNVDGLRAGKHKVRISHPNGASATKVAEVPVGGQKILPFRLSVLDTRVVLNDGAVKYGMLVSQDEFGDVTLAEFPSWKTSTFLKEQVDEIEKLSPAEAEEIRNAAADDTSPQPQAE